MKERSNAKSTKDLIIVLSATGLDALYVFLGMQLIGEADAN